MTLQIKRNNKKVYIFGLPQGGVGKSLLSQEEKRTLI